MSDINVIVHIYLYIVAHFFYVMGPDSKDEKKSPILYAIHPIDILHFSCFIEITYILIPVFIKSKSCEILV